VEVRSQLHAFWNSALDRGEWSTRLSGRFGPNIHRIECWMGTRGGLNNVEWNLLPLQATVQLLVYSHYTDLIACIFIISNETTLCHKIKAKQPRYRPGCDPEGGRGIALLFQDLGARREWVVSSKPRPQFTSRKDPVPICRGGWVGPRAGLEGRKISPPPGFDPPTVHPVVSRYTDWATRLTIK